jgi:hypothetical protein
MHNCDSSSSNFPSGVTDYKSTFLIAKLKWYKLLSSDQIQAEVIQAGDRTLWSEIHKQITSIRRKEELPDQWEESIAVPVYKKGDKIRCNNFLFNILRSC